MKRSIFLLLSLAAIIFIWLLLWNDTNNSSDYAVIKKKVEPEFVNEGKLYFLDDRDTISYIDIEIADNNKEISRGLMYRTHLDENQGMLFVFNNEEEKSFWMKNTRISLDIIYINSKNSIVHIARHTVPYSKDPIPSFEPAILVVEVNAGYCSRFNIDPGNKIVYNQN